MKFLNNKDNAWRGINKLVWQLGNYKASSPSKELHGSSLNELQFHLIGSVRYITGHVQFEPDFSNDGQVGREQGWRN